MYFEADLDVVIDGAEAHVRGDGAALIIESADPVALVGKLRRASGGRARRQLGQVADGLAAHGATLHVDGPHGRLVTVGAGADRTAAGLLVGTRHVAPGWGAAAATLGASVTRRRSAIVAAGLVFAISIGALARRGSARIT